MIVGGLRRTWQKQQPLQRPPALGMHNMFPRLGRRLGRTTATARKVTALRNRRRNPGMMSRTLSAYLAMEDKALMIRVNDLLDVCQDKSPLYFNSSHQAAVACQSIHPVSTSISHVQHQIRWTHASDPLPARPRPRLEARAAAQPGQTSRCADQRGFENHKSITTTTQLYPSRSVGASFWVSRTNRWWWAVSWLVVSRQLFVPHLFHRGFHTFPSRMSLGHFMFSCGGQLPGTIAGGRCEETEGLQTLNKRGCASGRFWVVIDRSHNLMRLPSSPRPRRAAGEPLIHLSSYEGRRPWVSVEGPDLRAWVGGRMVPGYHQRPARACDLTGLCRLPRGIDG
jgi:hypothetical protein